MKRTVKRVVCHFGDAGRHKGVPVVIFLKSSVTLNVMERGLRSRTLWRVLMRALVTGRSVTKSKVEVRKPSNRCLADGGRLFAVFSLI